MERLVTLSTLLSFAIVAFTIECDNECEHRMPHQTTEHGAKARGPWLTSMVMWWNCLRFVGDEGITLRDLQQRAGVDTNLNGMESWGYITLDTSVDGCKTARRADWRLHATHRGRLARQMWAHGIPLVERRWEERFGTTEIDRLRAALRVLVPSFDASLPDCMPILGYGLTSAVSRHIGDASASRQPVDELGGALPALLAKTLLAFALAFERNSAVSLAISANILRNIEDDGGVRVRDLPRLGSISKPAAAIALGFLVRNGYAVIEPESPSSKVKVARTTAKGRAARSASRTRVQQVEHEWNDAFGAQRTRALREALEPIVGDGTAAGSTLFAGLQPYPTGWRAKVAPLSGLPHFPMVLHRGGYPDGS